MSSQQVQVASLLLEENFGELVEKVGGFLLRHGASSLPEIIRGTELKPNQVAALQPHDLHYIYSYVLEM